MTPIDHREKRDDWYELFKRNVENIKFTSNGACLSAQRKDLGPAGVSPFNPRLRPKNTKKIYFVIAQAMISHPYTSGDWLIKAGREDEFAQSWKAFAEWSAANAPGQRSFHLIQDEKNPQHFISFGEWENTAAIDAWRATLQFKEFFNHVTQFCKKVTAGNFSLRAKG